VKFRGHIRQACGIQNLHVCKILFEKIKKIKQNISNTINQSRYIELQFCLLICMGVKLGR
jgi:hypothetical protein